jgi:hypothetical protein
VRSDALFAELRRETGSPLGVRVPFSLFGIVGNLEFFLEGWGRPPVWAIVAFVAIAVVIYPSLFILLWRTRKRGLLFWWGHPLAAARYSWWLLLWSAPDEPRWSRVFSIFTLAWVGVFSTGGFLRWGVVPY